MTAEERRGKELLKANGIQPDGLSAEDREALRRILRRDQARARTMKWAAYIAWGALLLFWIGFGAVSGAFSIRTSPGPTPLYVFPIATALFYFALYCTVSYVIRARGARNRESDVHAVEIEARLARIEDALKRLSKQS